MVTVPDRDAGGDAGGELWPEVIGVEAVVGDEDDGGVGPGFLQENLEHHVVSAVGGIDDVLIDLKVFIRDACHLGWMVVHEVMGDFIDRTVINGHEVPLGVAIHEVGGGGVDGVSLGEVLAEVVEALVAFLIDLVSLWEEGLEDFCVDLMGRDAHLVHGFGEILGPVGAGHGRGEVGGVHLGGGPFEVGEHVGDHFAIEVLLALRGEPGDEVGAEAFFAEHFPEGFAFAGGGGDGNDLSGDGIDFGEAFDPVVVGHFPGGDGGPKHGGELGLKGGEVAVVSAIHEGADAIHPAFGEELVDDFPIGGVPADKKDLLLWRR